ncbi:sigma-54-dependent transcriptional regulator [Neotabrizicola sp. VNH66]|uniref:sigma-54-dependent transcriptional regulator n=1 Tax=Neotabrizicola sp. VNH66 TaxID=3400918 RepID=UPI003C129C2D
MMAQPLVRLVDDDADLLAATAQALRLAGFRVETFEAAEAALQGLTPDYPGVVLSDVRMPGMDGLELQRCLQALDPDLPVILLTGHGDVPMAVAALKAGAWDFLTKPAGTDALTAALRRAVSARALVLENRLLRASRPEPEPGDPRLLGDSAVMVHLRQTLSRVAEAGLDALISGPVGAGKEAVARAIHAQGARRGRAFVHIICAALDPVAFEGEMLGRPAGASPRQGRLPGALEQAHRGTLYLDGIEHLPPAAQARLLTVLGAGEYRPAGAAAPRALELRLIASTSADLGALTAAGSFRADLFYRLSGIVLQVPPLSARLEDVPGLFRRFVRDACRRADLPVPALDAAIQARLMAQDWPGNLRELQQLAESVALGLAPSPSGPDPAGEGLTAMVSAYEAELLRSALRRSGGQVTRAMKALHLPRKTLYDKLARHRIDPAAFRPQDR